MTHLFSNGPDRDFVENIYREQIEKSTTVKVAAPYVTDTGALVQAVKRGKLVWLIVGLNTATDPNALSPLLMVPNCWVRYYTCRFHAKVYLFDTNALVGSSNLTDGGLRANREATICIEEHARVEDVRNLFLDLWEGASVLTPDTLQRFSEVRARLASRPPEDPKIEDAIGGRVQPRNISVTSRTASRGRIFVDSLRRTVYEQYLPAFLEVTSTLLENDHRRPELTGAGIASETNRFLNWVRLTFVEGDGWNATPLRSAAQRRAEIKRLGLEWASANRAEIPDDYSEWLLRVRRTFRSREAIEDASKDELTAALQSIHAFHDRYRFAAGGIANLGSKFWQANSNDIRKVKHTLAHLLYGAGDFVERLHDVLYDKDYKIQELGLFTLMELVGTVHPQDCPPINGRMAKALRFLGYDVPAE